MKMRAKCSLKVTVTKIAQTTKVHSCRLFHYSDESKNGSSGVLQVDQTSVSKAGMNIRT